MSDILDVYGREVLDSRGNPTVEVEVVLEDGSFGRAMVATWARAFRRPSSTSTTSALTPSWVSTPSTSAPSMPR